MNAVTWADYVRAIVGTDTGRAVAEKIGQSESTISRWKSGTIVPEPRQAVALAHAYGRNPLEALIAAGYLTAEEAQIPSETPRTLQLRDFTDLEIANEMVRRVTTEPGHELLAQPLNDDHPAMKEP